MADSLAQHYAEWGAASRFSTGGGGATVIATDSAQASGPAESLHFDENIKPLFRERDRDSMRFAFDLWSLDDVSTHAGAILERLDAGTMPCDGAWPAERVAVFRRWTRNPLRSLLAGRRGPGRRRPHNPNANGLRNSHDRRVLDHAGPGPPRVRARRCRRRG